MKLHTLEDIATELGIALDIPDEVMHGVHITCQAGADYLIASCGYLLDPLEQATEDFPPCAGCLAEAQCPVCGERLEARISRVQ